MSNFRAELHSDLARLFIDDLRYNRSRYYYFIGKPGESEEVFVENDVPDDSQISSDDVRSNMLFVRKIKSNEASLVCDLYEWKPNTVFEQWDHTQEMYGKMFYCVNSEYKVYKCLDNGGGAESTFEPLGSSIYPFRTSDNYLWKYLYTIPAFKRSKFMSGTQMPVQRALSDAFYNRGAIETVVVVNGGSGYTDQQLSYIDIAGTTTGSGATATINTVGPLGDITAINITNGGSGYTKGARITVNSNSGFGAILEPVISGGVITDINIIDGGFNYSDTLDTISITVGGAVLIPKLRRTDGSLDDIIILDPGVGYVSAPTLTLIGTIEYPGTGMYTGNSSAIINAIEDGGSIVRVTISDPGKEYPVDTATTITIFGDGTGALVSPVVYEGEIIDVIVEDSGEAYTYAITQISGTGEGAVIELVMDTSDFVSDQSIVEQATEPGAIYSIKLLDGGQDYSSLTTVTIEGDGSGCEAEAIIEQGTIIDIRVTSFGQNYTWAEVVVSDPISGTGADAYAIFPSPGGHGKDAETELFANGVALNVFLQENLPIDTFRQFGLLRNPRNVYSGVLFNTNKETLVQELSFSGTTNLEVGEILVMSNYRFQVVFINENVVGLLPLHKSNIVPVGQFIVENDPAREYQANQLLYTPEMNKYSGSLLYVSYEEPFSFTEEQGVVLRTFIKF